MQVEIMEKVLDTLNFQMRKERRNVILLLDTATVHLTSLTDMYSNIKVIFLPKNTTSRLQPLDTGIIQSFQKKYQKKSMRYVILMRYVIARINDGLFASEIAKGTYIFQAITWVADAWKEVSIETIKNCFATCGITEQTSEDEDDIVDREFNALFNDFADSECDMAAIEYVHYDVKTCSSLPAISSVQACVTEYLRKESGDLN